MTTIDNKQRPLQLAVLGACGRLGKSIVAELTGNKTSYPQIVLSAAIVRPGAESEGHDIGLLIGGKKSGVIASSEVIPAIAACDMVVDVSSSPAVAEHCKYAAQAGAGYLCGVTGLSAETEDQLTIAARHVPVLVSANFSVGAGLSKWLVRQVARLLVDAGYDCEIAEAHHRHKLDSPSGTALALAQEVTATTGLDIQLTRSGSKRRGATELGIAVKRAGGIIGDHQVSFTSMQEELTISHRVLDRAVFGAGALRLIPWLRQQQAGRYSMDDWLAMTLQRLHSGAATTASKATASNRLD